VQVSGRSWALIPPTEPRVARWCSIGSLLSILIFAPIVYVVFVVAASLSALVAFHILVPIVAGLGLIIAPITVYSVWYLPHGSPFLRMALMNVKSALFSRPVDLVIAADLMKVGEIKPKRAMELCIPAVPLNIRIPAAFEEEFKGDPLVGNTMAFRIADSIGASITGLPGAKPKTPFEEGENPVEYVMDRLNDIYPPIYELWDDKQSDLALARFCVAGLGAHRLDPYTPTRAGDENAPSEIHGGFALSHFCGDPAVEADVKNRMGVTIRCIPLDAPEEQGTCVITGRPSARRVVWGKSY
jgi:hypothetical protein